MKDGLVWCLALYDIVLVVVRKSSKTVAEGSAAAKTSSFVA